MMGRSSRLPILSGIFFGASFEGMTGSGSIFFNLLANPSKDARSASLTIGGQQVTVNQAGSGCVLGLSPSSGTLPVGGGTANFNVSVSGSDCTCAPLRSTRNWPEPSFLKEI